MHPASERMTKDVRSTYIRIQPGKTVQAQRHLRSTESPALALALTRPLLGMMPGTKQPLVGTWCRTGSNGESHQRHHATPPTASHAVDADTGHSASRCRFWFVSFLLHPDHQATKASTPHWGPMAPVCNWFWTRPYLDFDGAIRLTKGNKKNKNKSSKEWGQMTLVGEAKVG